MYVFLGFTLLFSFSKIVTIGSLFFALQLVTTYEWVHIIFIFLGYLTQDAFGGEKGSEYYSAVKNNGIIEKFSGQWMELEKMSSWSEVI